MSFCKITESQKSQKLLCDVDSDLTAKPYIKNQGSRLSTSLKSKSLKQ